uniref:Uncharacterized protein n=1 Tax=Arundo donax TaxID=35708 RepID=A0A0A9HAN2_ARUDO
MALIPDETATPCLFCFPRLLRWMKGRLALSRRGPDCQLLCT